MALFTPMTYWGGTPTFSPTSIPNLAGWYDASDTGSYRMSGTQIAGIRSQGTYGDDLDSTGSTYPVTGTTQNSLNTLYFNGSGYFVNPGTDTLVSNTGLHFAVGVFYPQQVDATKDSVWSVDSTYDYAVSAYDSSRWYGEIDLGNGVGSDGIVGPHSTNNKENQWIIVSAGFTKIQGANYVMMYVNSSTGSGTNWYTTYLTNLSQNQKLRIMANRNGNKKQAGRFGEIMLYKGDWGVVGSVHQYRYQAEGYLAWKWGLVGNLPSTHPYKNSPPT